ncbi:triple tyrosine motif-containing protein [Tenacibaculum sp. MAR_2009_124]|uniref:helix-turn-helix and ligand-binding sensor domain-containing protein n=1 Tax=Tenacibaculum sp. MAR_2009_124 TaxID=1250059 RepID=UPI0021012CBF|nr:triple tyrosine motif-containing protein [Tenacibaculum sp. MAR_2009_124]
MKLIKYLSFFLLFFFCNSKIYGQEFPLINIYYPEDYKAESQNWAISQSKNGTIYVANNLGLLEYNGASWQLYYTPNGTIMRSVKVVNDKIFTGFYMDFGYWLRDDFGELKYTSIVKKSKISILEDEQFWNILEFEEWILFQSLERIYLYNTKNKTCKTISSDVKITKLIEVNGEIYFQKFGNGLYKLEKGKAMLVSNHQIFKNQVIVDMYFDRGEILVLTDKKGFVTFKNGEINEWNSTYEILKDKSIYSSTKLANGNYALGSISDGILFFNERGEFMYNISQKNGLSNNTVLSVFEDINNNVWLGLDNGVNSINTEVPIKKFTEKEGKIGTVYTSIVYEGNLYLGTNQGLFSKRYPSNDEFKLVSGTQGQVWSLLEVDSELFCGHDMGTFIIENGKIKKQLNILGAWSFKRLNDTTILQGNYTGLYVLKKQNQGWQVKNKIEGFDNSSRSFEVFGRNQIFVNHEYKGVFKLLVDDNFEKVLKIEKDTLISKGVHSNLVKYNGRILYSFKKGIYEYTGNSTFIKDSTLSKLFNDKNYTSGKLVFDEKNNLLWSFSKNYISYVKPNDLNDISKIKRIPVAESLRKGAIGYENILSLNKNQFLTGVNNGYLMLDLENDKEKERSYEISIDFAKKYKQDLPKDMLLLNVEGEFSSSENNLDFYYSIPCFIKNIQPQYQYKLEGYSKSWSSWEHQSKILFENLPFGEYVFRVRGRVGNKQTTNEATYSFTINKPWYATNLMLVVYFLLILAFSYFMDRMYRGYYRRQRKRLLEKKEREFELKSLENEKMLMKVKNEQLRIDVESKSRELATSTMSIIKKNELLGLIKNELVSGNDKSIKDVIKIIDKNLNNTDDWQMFKEAFNNADKDFIKKIKGLHPTLTPNDLRLCAYLRLNLSSKEIAPLLNISPRSVEVKRYRLRKKMNLDHDMNLTDYILSV